MRWRSPGLTAAGMRGTGLLQDRSAALARTRTHTQTRIRPSGSAAWIPEGCRAFQKAIPLYKQLNCKNVAQRHRWLRRQRQLPCTPRSAGAEHGGTRRTARLSLMAPGKSGLLFLFCFCRTLIYLANLNGKLFSAGAVSHFSRQTLAVVLDHG